MPQGRASAGAQGVYRRCTDGTGRKPGSEKEKRAPQDALFCK